jgi:CDP-diacylglycerol--glycerol-3-phosphate 3-phosphatidyltransferase
MGWANRITLARAFLTLCVWVLIIWADSGSAHANTLWYTACGIFIFAAVSDVVDGFLARKLQEVSVFGRIADPLVDKMLTIGTMIVLLGVAELHSWLPAWAVALIFTREILVTTIRGAIEGRGINFSAIWFGKYKMVLQCAAAGGLLLIPVKATFVYAEIPFLAGLPGAPGTWNFAHVLVWLATIVTLASGYVYAMRAKRVLAENPERDAG